jgi:hypothetical protein
MVWRSAATAPIVLVGDPAKVRALLGDVQDRLPERQTAAVDLWVRTEGAGVGGPRRKLVKRSLVILYGMGDIERSRVCASRPCCLPCLSVGRPRVHRVGPSSPQHVCISQWALY